MKINYHIIFYIICIILHLSEAFAALPGAADPSRISPREINIPRTKNFDQGVISSNIKIIATPHEAKKIKFVLKKVQIEHNTAFDQKDLEYIYHQYLNKEMKLSVAYEIANKITQHYYKAGYFLSMAYLPEQKIKNGVIVIRILEGYISEVEVPKEVNNYVVKDYVKKLTSLKPVKILQVEEFILRLNDLPGYDFKAVFNKEDTNDAGVKITLECEKRNIQKVVSFDNFSSRYFGPNEFSLYLNSPFALQQTNFLGLVSAPTNKLRYGKIDHKIFFMPNTFLELSRSVTKSNPKFLLKDLEIQSNNVSNGIGIHYKFLRQRRENLSFALNFNTTDYKVNTLNKTALTRDHVRALRFKINYDFIDRFFAHNSAELEFSNGIRGLGASKKGDLNLSRAKAIPNFAKTELRLQKLQPLTKKISIKLSTVGQYSANTLYSSEQFGYGGNLFGRAYDASEITGDKGVIAAMELIYHAPHDQGFFRKSPFMFYDVGKVWSANEKKNISCASAAGIGLRYNTQYGQTGEIVFAMPIKRKISHPIYGLSKGGPRILFLFAQQI